jgi:hypothetical protein
MDTTKLAGGLKEGHWANQGAHRGWHVGHHMTRDSAGGEHSENMNYRYGLLAWSSLCSPAVAPCTRAQAIVKTPVQRSRWPCVSALGVTRHAVTRARTRSKLICTVRACWASCVFVMRQHANRAPVSSPCGDKGCSRGRHPRGVVVDIHLIGSRFSHVLLSARPGAV